MLRPAFAACLGAAFGALTIGTARERFADMLVQPIEAYSLAFVSAAAFLLAVLVLACREPARSSGNRAVVFDGSRLNPEQRLYTVDNSDIALSEGSLHPVCRDNPMTGTLGVRPLRDTAGRFVKAS